MCIVNGITEYLNCFVFREYDEETVVYDFPEGQNSPWDSYGAGQNIAR